MRTLPGCPLQLRWLQACTLAGLCRASPPLAQGAGAARSHLCVGASPTLLPLACV